MKSVGERIRQARDAVGMSGETLAKKVGYKNQSAIGNLENRAGGTGGNKVREIAAALNVSVDWLLNGPDSDTVPFLTGGAAAGEARTVTEPAPPSYAEADPVLRDAMRLLGKMSKAGWKEAIPYLTFLVEKYPASTQTDPGERDPVPHSKAA